MQSRENLAEASVFAQRIEARLGPEINEPPRPPRHRPLQPLDGAVVLAEGNALLGALLMLVALSPFAGRGARMGVAHA